MTGLDLLLRRLYISGGDNHVPLDRHALDLTLNLARVSKFAGNNVSERSSQLTIQIGGSVRL